MHRGRGLRRSGEHARRARPESYGGIAHALANWATVAVVGPGLGPHAATGLARLLARIDQPLVLDADGLNALEDRTLLARLGEDGRARVLTPHPGEMSRLVRQPIDEVQAHREAVAVKSARSWGAVVVLKRCPHSRRCTGWPHFHRSTCRPGTRDRRYRRYSGGADRCSPGPGKRSVPGGGNGRVRARRGRAAAPAVGSSPGVLASELLPAIPEVMQRLRDADRTPAR